MKLVLGLRSCIFHVPKVTFQPAATILLWAVQYKGRWLSKKNNVERWGGGFLRCFE